MKKLIFILFIILSSMFVNAQTDVIYTVDSGNIIFDCKIIEVKYGDMVVYRKDSVTSVVEAYQIIKDGNKIELTKYIDSVNSATSISTQPQEKYNGKSYKYYEETRKGALKLRNVGIFMTIPGIILTIAGQVKMNEGYYNYTNDGFGLLLVGSIMSDVGIALWIAGGIKASNNRKAMEKFHNTSLSFGATHDGIGLTLAFD